MTVFSLISFVKVYDLNEPLVPQNSALALVPFAGPFLVL